MRVTTAGMRPSAEVEGAWKFVVRKADREDLFQFTLAHSGAS